MSHSEYYGCTEPHRQTSGIRMHGVHLKEAEHALTGRLTGDAVDGLVHPAQVLTGVYTNLQPLEGLGEDPCSQIHSRRSVEGPAIIRNGCQKLGGGPFH